MNIFKEYIERIQIWVYSRNIQTGFRYKYIQGRYRQDSDMSIFKEYIDRIQISDISIFKEYIDRIQI